MIGQTISHYRIVEKLGAGGMGEVYRATDSRLGRDVALKVLPEAFALDAQRMARFEREAKVLASLNHPNIASIYGLEESDSMRALVMELVEGQTLAERIKQGPLPLDEPLLIAKQIAEGLEYAHERGIIHRDLKPSNIKVTAEGQVKLLDFGLAKAIEGETSEEELQNSPTLSAAATRAGMLLGTAAYMSPEQARGKRVDRRADIWAFGCVLYEMLTGRGTFNGETTSDILASVIRAEPDWSAVPGSVPARIRELLRRCLHKDPRQRLQAIGEARIVMEEAVAGLPEQPSELPARTPRGWVYALPWVIAAVLGITLAVFVRAYLRVPNTTVPASVSQILPPEKESFALVGRDGDPPMLSPDGKRLAFLAADTDGNQRLWIRPLNATAGQPLAGTDGATMPFWSPDGQHLGFVAGGKLNRIDAAGGPPLALCDVVLGRGGAWSTQGTILFSPALGSPISRVPAAGGVAQPVTKLASDHIAHRWPQFLPDGKHFLYYLWSSVPDKRGTYVASLDGGEPRLVIPGDTVAVYAPLGYLLYVHNGTLIAQHFDANSLRPTGDATPLAERVGLDESHVGRALFSVSQNGLLVYSEASQAGRNQLLWFDRNGKKIGEAKPGNYSSARISPDGRHIAVALIEPNMSSYSLWVSDLTRGVDTRLTFEDAVRFATPVWSPDGKLITFSSNRGGASQTPGPLRSSHLYEKAADGTGEILPVVVDANEEQYPAWSSDGRYLLFSRTGPQEGTNFGIWALPSFGDRKEFPVVKGQFFVDQPDLSPDGKWLAFRSLETGSHPEIYVIPFGGGSGKWQVSTGWGAFPRWRHDGRELFYLARDDKIMAAEIAEEGSGLRIGKVSPLFRIIPSSDTIGAPYDVTADGKKFLVVSQTASRPAQPLTLITNWPALLSKQ